MERDTQLLKIQVYADYCNAEFDSLSSYVLRIIIAYYISLMVLYLQKIIDPIFYLVYLFSPLPIFFLLLWSIYRTYSKKLSRVDKLVEKLDKGEPIPSIEDMIKGKTWKTE